MATLEESRAAVDEQVSKARTRAQELRDQADQQRADTRATADEVLASLEAAMNSSRELQKAEKLPVYFTGTIINYRFGMAEGDPAPNAMPSHRFEVDCGDGLWLHVNVGSDKFDPFIADTDVAVLTEGGLNGETVTVRRDPSYGRIIPVKLGFLSTGVPVTEDKNGDPICIGDTVAIKQYGYSKRGKAQVIDWDESTKTLTVKRPDRKSNTIIRDPVGRYALYEKIDGAPVEKIELGSDMNGAIVFKGSRVRCANISDGGNQQGVVLDRRQDVEGQYAVKLDDGRKGAGPNGEWYVQFGDTELI